MKVFEENIKSLIVILFTIISFSCSTDNTKIEMHKEITACERLNSTPGGYENKELVQACLDSIE